jgi:NAD(P)-dependent dehydrogenase (short-subunit alcohol dehydrogenase family)
VDVVLDANAARLDGKVVVVTGGGSGIGRGVANGVRAFGAEVAIWERDAATCAAAAAEVGGLSIQTDVRDAEQVDAALVATLDHFGTVDVLVNNAGGVFPKPFLETRENGFDALYRANLKHVLLCSKAVAAHMVDAGHGGAMVNITSIEGVRAAPLFAAYAAAKAGVINLTKTLALELAPHGIRVNAIAPDITLTEGILAMSPSGSTDRMSLTVPMGRPGHVDECAGAAVFLASQLSSYVTGHTLHVDGGTHASMGWYHHPEDGHYVYGAW